MKVIGLTGGVGSGKSMVADYLEKKYHALLLITDEIGHKVMEPGTEGYQRIVDAFQGKPVGEDGSIDRKTLADIVFASPEALQALNEIIHPEVIRYIKQTIEERRNEPGWIVLESALLFESRCDLLCDEIWYIRVSEEVRRKRLADSRGYSREKTSAIMKKQMSEEEFMKRCDVIIENDGSKEHLFEEADLQLLK